MGTKKEISALFGMEPKEAVDYIKQKGLKTSWDYTEVWGEAHQRTFTVAKLMKLDILKDIHDSLAKAAKEGTPFKEWKARLKPTLVAKGWYGRAEVFNPQTGEFKTINVGSRRLKTIYETNMRSAYNYGRYKHLQQSTMPYWMYVSALLPTTRDTHRAMHGAVYAKDHPFWNANYPPNGYNCKCKVRGYTKKMLEQRGMKPRENYETIADVGFTHKPTASVLSDVWDNKILNAPKSIAPLAKQEKTLNDMYDTAFEHDKAIANIMTRIKPPFEIKEQGIEGRYDYGNGKFIFWQEPVSVATLRHEAGHRLDHYYNWISKSIQSSVILEGAALTKSKQTIEKMLEAYEDDVQLQDLFFLSSRRKVGVYPTRRNDYEITQEVQAREAFANFFAYYIANDTQKLAIIKTYFPNSYKKFLKEIAKLKERP